MKKMIFILIVSLNIVTLSEITKYSSETVMVPMRDGTNLSTKIYKPLLGNSWPVILMRTPYDKDALAIGGLDILDIAVYLLGSAIVVQDTRGRYDSEGIDSIFLDNGWGERQDGYDAIEWLAEQDWCNGKICIMGASALAINAYSAAGALPPHLTCVISIVAPSDLYEHAAYWGGAFRKELVEKWLNSINSLHMENYIKSHPTKDSAWESVNFENRIPLINIPMLHIGGWYDCFSQGNINAFNLLRQNSLNRENQYLVMGPWTHGTVLGNSSIGDVDFSNIENFNGIDFLFDFAKHFLREEPGAIDGYSFVNYYLMEDPDAANPIGNQWIQSDNWPPDSNRLQFYLDNQYQLRLGSVLDTNRTSLSFSSNPENPVPTIGGNNLNIVSGIHGQSSLSARDDIIRFFSDTLDNPVEICGNVKVKLYFSSNCRDIDICAKLCDIYPDGKAYNILDGVAKARYIDQNFQSEQFLVPDSIYEIEIDLWSTAYVFQKGHQIRLDISGSNYPKYEINRQNGGELFDTIIAPQIAENKLYFSSNYPSKISFQGKTHLMNPVQPEQKNHQKKDWVFFNLYPNPIQNQGQISCYINQLSSVKLEIHSISGQKIMDFTPQLKKGLNVFSIHAKKFSSGVYFLSLKKQNRKETIKFTILK